MDNVVSPSIYSAAKHTITQPQYKKKKSVEKCDSSSWLMDRVEEGNQIYISEKKNERGLKSRAFIYIRSHAQSWLSGADSRSFSSLEALYLQFFLSQKTTTTKKTQLTIVWCEKFSLTSSDFYFFTPFFFLFNSPP